MTKTIKKIYKAQELGDDYTFDISLQALEFEVKNYDKKIKAIKKLIKSTKSCCDSSPNYLSDGELLDEVLEILNLDVDFDRESCELCK